MELKFKTIRSTFIHTTNIQLNTTVVNLQNTEHMSFGAFFSLAWKYSRNVVKSWDKVN